MEKRKYILAFESTNYAIAAEKRLQELFKITVIPTPREITSNCGLSIKINEDDLNLIKTTLKDVSIPGVLYSLQANAPGPNLLEKLLTIA